MSAAATPNKLEPFIRLGRGSTSSTHSQTPAGWGGKTREQHSLCVSVKITKDFWRSETCGSAASSRTCNKLAELTAAETDISDGFKQGEGEPTRPQRMLRLTPTLPLLASPEGRTAPWFLLCTAAPGSPDPAARAPSPLPCSVRAPALGVCTALPKPAGRASGRRSLPSGCCATHRRLKPGQRRDAARPRHDARAMPGSPALPAASQRPPPLQPSLPSESQGKVETRWLHPSLCLSVLVSCLLLSRQPVGDVRPEAAWARVCSGCWRPGACRGPAHRAGTSARCSTTARRARGQRRTLCRCAFGPALVQPLAPAGYGAFFHRVEKR